MKILNQNRFCSVAWLTISLTFLLVAEVAAQFEFDKEPLNYKTAEVDDAVFQLSKKLEQGLLKLEWDENRGWLPSLLKHLNITDSSQTLVFTKTSLQLNKISPSNPRAIYFNDETYVGFVPGGDFIELSAVDPNLGAIFYSIQQQIEQPYIARDQSRCMTCHGTNKTQGVPGYLVRSVFPSESGHPHYEMGTITTDHRTDFKERFGGWYVTGNHGEMRHRGNAIAKKNDPPIDFETGANLVRLPDRIKTKNYMTATSDVVALMLLEHQSQMHNYITKANYETRQALHYQQEMNRITERPEEYQLESTTRRIESAAEKLLEYMLFCGEYQLESPIAKDSPFVNYFASLGPRDSRNRSLHDFDLQTRMFRYPCSFLIYSDSFEGLPEPVLAYLARRIHEVLSGQDQSKTFSHLSAEDRKAILEILAETKPTITERWRDIDQEMPK